MAKYDLLVDGKRAARVGSEQDVREWLVRYRDEHRHDDPDAAHVLVLKRTPLAFFTGGRLLDRERFVEVREGREEGAQARGKR